MFSENEAAAHIDFDSDQLRWIGSKEVKAFDGRLHDIYFVFSGKDIELNSWYFEKNDEPSRAAEPLSAAE
ncbi:MAG: hypothetical protein IKN66_04430 [Ruminococcus sp.]|nr:hypothetical protein [Ruminococcus sp.]